MYLLLHFILFFFQESPLAKCSSSSNLWAGNREKVRSWVKERAGKFIINYISLDSSCSQDPSRILETLTKAITTLQSAVNIYPYPIVVLYFKIIDITKGR